MRESFATASTSPACRCCSPSLIAVPLAYLTVRFEFRGAVADPDAGRAAADHAALRRRGGDAAALRPLGLGQPAAQGRLRLHAADHGGAERRDLRRDPALLPVHPAEPHRRRSPTSTARWRKPAQNLGATGWRLFRRVVFPLAMPGYVAGASLVFVKVFDDLGTPLVLDVTNLLAPQAYLRITLDRARRPDRLRDQRDHDRVLDRRDVAVGVVREGPRLRDAADAAARQRAAAQLTPLGRRCSPTAGSRCVLLLVLSPHLGLLLLSLCEGVELLGAARRVHAGRTTPPCSRTRSGMIGNTFLYCGLAALLDVVLGTAIAYLILRTQLPGRQWLDYMVTVALADARPRAGDRLPAHVPGRRAALRRAAAHRELGDVMLAYAVRRLPYALRSCMAALQQVHVIARRGRREPGRDRWRTVRRVVVPLMVGGILAGFVTSFITAAVELSATILLVAAESQAPMSYGIYLYMQSIGRAGPRRRRRRARRHCRRADRSAHAAPTHRIVATRVAATLERRRSMKARRVEMPQRRRSPTAPPRCCRTSRSTIAARRVLRAARAVGLGQVARCCG